MKQRLLYILLALFLALPAGAQKYYVYSVRGQVKTASQRVRNTQDLYGSSVVSSSDKDSRLTLINLRKRIMYIINLAQGSSGKVSLFIAKAQTKPVSQNDLYDILKKWTQNRHDATKGSTAAAFREEETVVNTDSLSGKAKRELEIKRMLAEYDNDD